MRSVHLLFFLSLSLCFFAPSSCGQSYIRFIHGVEGLGAATSISYNQTSVNINVNFGEATPFLPFSSLVKGASFVVHFEPGAQVNTTLVLNSDQNATLWAAGTLQNHRLIQNVVSSSQKPSTYSFASVRFLNSIANSTNLQIQIPRVVFSGSSFATGTDYVDVAGGTFNVSLANSTTTLDTVQMTFIPGQVYTLFGLGPNFQNPKPTLKWFLDGDFRRSFIRFANAAPGSGPVNITVNDKLLITDLNFTDTSSYNLVPSGNVAIQIMVGRLSPFSRSYTIWPGQNCILFYTGPPSQAVWVVEDLQDTSEKASIRFINLTPDRLQFNLTSEASSIGGVLRFGNTTSPTSVPAGNYTLKIRPTTDKAKRVWTKRNGEFAPKEPQPTQIIDQALTLNTTTYLGLILGTSNDLVFVLNHVPSINPPSPPLPNENVTHGLTTIAIASIIVGSILAVLLVVGLFFYYHKTRIQYQTIP